MIRIVCKVNEWPNGIGRLELWRGALRPDVRSQHFLVMAWARLTRGANRLTCKGLPRQCSLRASLPCGDDRRDGRDAFSRRDACRDGRDAAVSPGSGSPAGDLRRVAARPFNILAHNQRRDWEQQSRLEALACGGH